MIDEPVAPTRPPEYAPSPTVDRFIKAIIAGPPDEMRVLILRGPRGTGKTTGGIWACCSLADRIQKDGVPLPLRVGVVRDTWTNLERTTLVSFEEWKQQGLEIEFLNGRKEAVIGGTAAPSVHFWFFGLDRPDDADKLQGFQCGLLWLEEVAPAAGVATGVPASALGIGATSVRQQGVPPRIIVTMNPPDKNHWILKVEDYLRAAGLTHVRVRHFVMDAREKAAHFLTMAQLEDDPLRAKAWKDAAVAFERYTERNRAFLESVGRKDLVARLVEGEIGEVRLGAAVVPNFSRRLHVPAKPLEIVRGVEIVRGWDSGVNDLHPAVAWIQCGPDWFNVLGSRVGTNMSLEEFIRREVWPFEKKYGIVKARASLRGAGARGGFLFRNIGDPAMFSSDGRGSRTAALIIESLLHESVEPGPVEWTARREALFAAFARKGAGDRLFVNIDPDENEILIDGLAGRYHYTENKSTGEPVGDIASAKRASGIYCVDSETEILTGDGWKTVGEVRAGALAFGYDWSKGGVVPTRILGIQAFGRQAVIKAHVMGGKSIVVTPEHRCPIIERIGKGGRQLQLTVRPASELKPWRSMVIAAPPGAVSHEVIDDARVRIAGWFGADGHILRDKRHGVRISQSSRANPLYVADLDRLLPTEFKRRVRRDGIVIWESYGPIARWLRAVMPRRRPGGLLRSLSSRQAALFLYEFARGDGCWPGIDQAPTPAAYPSFSLGKFSPWIVQRDGVVIDDLQAIAVVAGLHTRAKRLASGYWSLRLMPDAYATRRKRTRRPVGPEQTAAKTWLPIYRITTGTAEVWCPQTQLGNWIARRDGLVFLTGNSHPVDAIAYPLTVLYPAQDWMREQMVEKAPGGPPAGWMTR